MIVLKHVCIFGFFSIILILVEISVGLVNNYAQSTKFSFCRLLDAVHHSTLNIKCFVAANKSTMSFAHHANSHKLSLGFAVAEGNNESLVL
jgi:hypothetical protein